MQSQLIPSTHHEGRIRRDLPPTESKVTPEQSRALNRQLEITHGVRPQLLATRVTLASAAPLADEAEEPVEPGGDADLDVGPGEEADAGPLDGVIGPNGERARADGFTADEGELLARNVAPALKAKCEEWLELLLGDPGFRLDVRELFADFIEFALPVETRSLLKHAAKTQDAALASFVFESLRSGGMNSVGIESARAGWILQSAREHPMPPAHGPAQGSAITRRQVKFDVRRMKKIVLAARHLEWTNSPTFDEGVAEFARKFPLMPRERIEATVRSVHRTKLSRDAESHFQSLLSVVGPSADS